MDLVISKNAFSSKPSGNGMWYVQQRGSYDYIPFPGVREFAQMMVDGHTVRVGYSRMPRNESEDHMYFNSKMIEYNQMFILDFDTCKFTPWEVCEFAEKQGIPANFWYWSFSQRPEKSCPSPYGNGYIYNHNNKESDKNLQLQTFKDLFNFRVVWVLEKPLKPGFYEEVIGYLANDLFAEFEPDPAPTSCETLFHGGSTEGYILNEELVPATHVQWTALCNQIKKGKTVGKITRNKNYVDYEGIEFPDAISITGNWWEKLRGRCVYWDSFEDGTIRYNELLILLSHLKYLRYDDAGKSIQKDLVRIYEQAPQHLSTTLQDDLEGTIYKKFRDTKLKPVFGIVQVGNRKVTVPDFFKYYQNESYSQPTVEKVSLEELDEWMRVDLKDALLSKENVIIQSQTGSGKTKAYLEVLAGLNYFNQKIIVALPTYITMNEVYNKFIAMRPDVNCYKTEPIENLSELDKKKLRLGISVSRTEERQEVLDLLQDDEATGLFFITHELLAVLRKIKASLIIVDENIEESLTKTYKITSPQLSSMITFLNSENRENLLKFIDYYESKERGEEIDTMILDYIFDDLRKNSLDDYLACCKYEDLPPALFSLTYNEVKKSEMRAGNKSIPCLRILRHSPLIEYARANHIPIKLLTATPLHQRLINYYEQDFKIIKAPIARNTGEVVFYRGYTGAKGNGCDKIPRLIKYIKSSLTQEQIDNSIVITFKDAVEQFEKEGFTAAFVEDSETYVHLRNNAGLDQFKGKDIIVAGKFELPDECYLDIADDLYIKEPNKCNTAIDHNGVKQTLFLWQDPQLMNEQLQYLEFITSQAIGRARALREDATVYVFSNYITLDADKVYD